MLNLVALIVKRTPHLSVGPDWVGKSGTKGRRAILRPFQRMNRSPLDLNGSHCNQIVRAYPIIYDKHPYQGQQKRFCLDSSYRLITVLGKLLWHLNYTLLDPTHFVRSQVSLGGEVKGLYYCSRDDVLSASVVDNETQILCFTVQWVRKIEFHWDEFGWQGVKRSFSIMQMTHSSSPFWTSSTPSTHPQENLVQDHRLQPPVRSFHQPRLSVI